MNYKRTIIILALLALAGSAHAQSSLGGPRKPANQIGGAKPATNPVVATPHGSQAAPTANTVVAPPSGKKP